MVWTSIREDSGNYGNSRAINKYKNINNFVLIYSTRLPVRQVRKICVL